MNPRGNNLILQIPNKQGEKEIKVKTFGNHPNHCYFMCKQQIKGDRLESHIGLGNLIISVSKFKIYINIVYCKHL